MRSRRIESGNLSDGLKRICFKKIAMALSKRGLGSYIEVFNHWTLDDYETYLEVEKEATSDEPEYGE